MKVYCFEPGKAKRLGYKQNENCAMTLRAEMGDNQAAVAYNEEINMQQNDKSAEVKNACAEGNGDALESSAHATLPGSIRNQAMQGHACAKVNSAVRRLTPIETERLMGFPDNHTRIKWGGKDEENCPDELRYKCCGNSMCVNCMEWIGRRISIVESLIREEENKNIECSEFDN